jgi:DNA invertase Pin-like site-specific DNA recombinase
MSSDADRKVTTDHLRRDAYLYVRQSTLRQVIENQESTKRQYALRERALALGWPAERIVTIDSDLGHSGASSADRPGFQRLVADVGLGRVGIVLGLEVSRLARSSSDWVRLLEICAIAGTLILDEDGIYDPDNFNDRLLLGLKGTMSEAELHFLHARLRGGVLSKARRGELRSPLPIGFVYGPQGKVTLDPDRQVQDAIRHFFATFRRTGSALATVKAFREEGMRLPLRPNSGPHKGELHWEPLVHSRTLQILHNPRYAGAFFFGRRRSHKTVDGRKRELRVPREEWIAFFPGAHPGYITWDEYEENNRRLQANAAARGIDRRKAPAREGPALLQGVVLCGRCGGRMTVRYVSRASALQPIYVCQRDGIEHAKQHCQTIPGADVDAAVGRLIVEAVTPMALEVTLGVQKELEARAAELDKLRYQQVERARYLAELAQRRYMAVDPANRLVAVSLEAEWNAALQDLRQAQEEYKRQRQADRLTLSEEQNAQVLALAGDIPRLWHDPKTSDRDRKRLLRLIVEDVTLLRNGDVTVHIRFKGGSVQSITLPVPLPAHRLYRTPEEIVREIDRLLDEHGTTEIARILNARGLRSGHGVPFNHRLVDHIIDRYDLTPRLERLHREGGLLTAIELADHFGVDVATVHDWHHRGLLRAYRFSARRDLLFEPPGPDLPAKGKHKHLRDMKGPETQCR